MKYSELAKKLETATSETRNLIVRPFRNSDEDGLLELFRDQNTMRMDGDTPILEKNDEFIRRINLIKEGPLIWLFSEEKKSSDFVGYIMLQDEGDAIALGFALTASKQFMGYGFEMVEAVIKMLFNCGVEEIRIKTWEKNLPCQKLADKLGFIKTDIIKGKHKDPLTGEISDDIQYSLKNSHTS